MKRDFKSYEIRMRYFNYAMRNNVFATLYTPISSLATTVQVDVGQGARFGDKFPILATLEHMVDTKCVKREIVKITGVNGDILTVVRGYAPCPANDDANNEGTTRFSFDSGDTISMYIPKEIFDNINESIIDLYENGSDRIFAKKKEGLILTVTGGNVRVGSEEFEFQGGEVELVDNATNNVMVAGDGLLEVLTDGWDQNKTKIATVTTENGEITNIKQWRMDTIGGTLGGSTGFKHIERTVYKRGFLTSFVADGELYELEYRSGLLIKIKNGEKEYDITYKTGRVMETIVK